MRRTCSPRIALLLGLALVWLVDGLTSQEQSAAAMAKAANGFLTSLTPETRQRAAFPFESDDRSRWHYVPTEMFPREGLTLKNMTDTQRARAHDLLKAGLSQKGYLTTTAIIELETLLGAIETRERFNRDPLWYHVSIFGTPSATGTWAWRVNGHHVALNFTIVNGRLVSSTPSFFGSNPAEVKDGPKKGLRILAELEDTGRALAMSLDSSQREKAVIDAVAPAEILTTNVPRASPLPAEGIAASALNSQQRTLLMQLIDAYAGQMAPDVAADRVAKLHKAGVDTILFAWAGDMQRGQKHYYRVQGPTFLIEYDHTQDNGNHAHTVWRDFDGDFGRDLLREHIKAAHD